jgi:hypothetical protein
MEVGPKKRSKWEIKIQVGKTDFEGKMWSDFLHGS